MPGGARSTTRRDTASSSVAASSPSSAASFSTVSSSSSATLAERECAGLCGFSGVAEAAKDVRFFFIASAALIF